jgi:hypothetical protein
MIEAVVPISHTSAEFASLAGDCQVALSLGHKGQCWANALAESFFSSLKGELTDHQAWPARAAARRAIVEYIGWYNGTRPAQHPRLPQPCRIRGLSQKRDTPASSLTSYQPCPSKRGNPT